jgi:hypothetical protein
MVMHNTFEFNSLNDWPRVDQQLRRNVRALHNPQHRRQISKMQDNLYHSITELSKAEIDYRRTLNNTVYLSKLATVREQLHHLQQWLMFATLIDTKSEE